MGWRGKLFFLLFFYIAGFATAVYCIVPVSSEQNAYYAQKGFPYTATKSDQFAKSCSVTLTKGLRYAKDATHRTVEYVKTKSNERPNAQTAAINR